jgi:hypothetical protein
MDGPRDALFAGAALARDEDGRAHGRDSVDHVLHGLHRTALAEQLARGAALLHLRLEAKVLFHERVLLQRATHQGSEGGGLERLGDEVEGASAHGRDGVFHGVVRREQDHLAAR